ncbi:hypothetical protein [Amycolatopsis jiangsuensis]|uniref:Uncharacterized protein n=1 Tax=Amycolatopsis jiangsuensis TaxID=1181879 RepID=A0A840IRH6_9PSEU|nr:hypothetical protein [Amycolatopsis jiangsuensis]MBB4683977.1 hypothetical protein [Amycolatopsis jiangsuensis]
MDVTVADLRGLLGSPDDGAILVLVEGRLRTVPADARDSGAIPVISRAALDERLEGRPATDRELELIAATLTTGIAEQGA